MPHESVSKCRQSLSAEEKNGVVALRTHFELRKKMFFIALERRMGEGDARLGKGDCRNP